MKKVLFMHGGSGNHGCEAIIRTTAKLLNGPSELVLWSLAKQEDIAYGASQGYDTLVTSEELKRGSLPWLEALIRRRVLRQPNANMQVFLKNLFRNSIAISIGGDNYCYPWSAQQAGELNAQLRRMGVSTVLWACSIDPEAITENVRTDLAAYDLITARESLTYNLLKEINPNTVQVADPAFLLEPEFLPLPKNFAEGNTVGINVSPLIMKYGSDSLIMKNYEQLIRRILNETDMHVCLIPHVVWDCNDDRIPLRRLYEAFRESGRICMLEDHNACILKGYIARCRFFVGARTHATIAAYSTCVPTLVVGYSIKSRGIAIDLFGMEENYVLPVQNLKKENELCNAFDWLTKNERIIRTHLETIMPAYREKAKIPATLDLFQKGN